VTGILHRLNSSSFAFDSASNIAELSTRNIFWGKRWPVLRADNLATLRKIWEIQPVGTLRARPDL